eukprot:COSAG04_NODE_4858_length_1858_cov_2.468063_3_plen_128_part_00
MEIRTYTNRPACVKSVRKDEDGNAGVLAHFQGVIDLANDVDQPHPNPAGAQGPRCMCAKISSAVEPLPLSTLSAVAESRPVREIVAEALEALVVLTSLWPTEVRLTAVRGGNVPGSRERQRVHRPRR